MPQPKPCAVCRSFRHHHPDCPKFVSILRALDNELKDDKVLKRLLDMFP